MAYDEELAHRIRAAIDTDFGERRMFGGLAFLINGNMAVAASGRGGLLVRVDPAESEALLRAPHVERMVMQGREMAGWLLVGAEALDSDEHLQRWVSTGVAYAGSLPAT